jgi:hypothetical protein
VTSNAIQYILNYKISRFHASDLVVDPADTAAHNTAHTQLPSLRAPPTSIRLTEVIETLYRLERPEHSSQEQFCDPLVPSDTYWYLTATPELLQQAAARLEACSEVGL